MSLMRAILRRSAIHALTNKTWASARVLDSDNTPLADILKDQQPAPYITIYTDVDTRTNIRGRDVFIADRATRLIIEFGVAGSVSVPADPSNPTGETVQKVDIPATDAGMEFVVDVVEGQILTTLFGQQGGDWAELFKSIILKMDRMPSQRGASADRSRRWAARQMIVHCDIIADKPMGNTIQETHVYRRFVTLATAEGGAAADLAVIVQKLLDASDAIEYPEWKQIQSVLGLTRQEIIALGLATGPKLGEDISDDEEIESGIQVVQQSSSDQSSPPFMPYDWENQ